MLAVHDISLLARSRHCFFFAVKLSLVQSSLGNHFQTSSRMLSPSCHDDLSTIRGGQSACSLLEPSGTLMESGQHGWLCELTCFSSSLPSAAGSSFIRCQLTAGDHLQTLPEDPLHSSALPLHALLQSPHHRRDGGASRHARVCSSSTSSHSNLNQWFLLKAVGLWLKPRFLHTLRSDSKQKSSENKWFIDRQVTLSTSLLIPVTEVKVMLSNISNEVLTLTRRQQNLHTPASRSGV